MIKIYKIKWVEEQDKNSPAIELDRIRLVLADNIEQIAKQYPTLESVQLVGIAIDLRV